MARKQSKGNKKRTSKRSQRGGGWGFTGAGSIPGTPGTVSNPMVYTGIGDCRAVRPGYDIPYSQYGASLKGLPGMSGGGKSRKGMRKNRTMKQRGGRYGFAPELDPNPSGQAWWAGSYAPVQRIGCEGGAFNPLNPTHTLSSAPGGAANANYWMAKGGAQTMAPATYGVGNVDSMYYYAPTGGYANTASTWKDSVGAPVQIQVPYAARAMNQACLTTGGAPPLTGALQQGGKRGKGTKRGRRQRGGVSIFGLFDVPTPNISGVTSRLPKLPSWLGGPSAEPVVVAEETKVVKIPSVNTNPSVNPFASESNKYMRGINTGNIYNATRNLRKNNGMSANKMTAPAPTGTATEPPKNYGPLPPSPPGTPAPAGGRRHKKSRKHRKQRKH